MTADELRARIELIKKRQKAATSSVGTKALLIQTFSEDLPWLIEQAERVTDAESKLAECEREKAEYEQYISNLATDWGKCERKLAAARETLRDMLNSIRSSHKVGIGAPNNTYVPQISVAQADEWEKSLAALTEAGEQEKESNERA